jgi:hypothetical protein
LPATSTIRAHWSASAYIWLLSEQAGGRRCCGSLWSRTERQAWTLGTVG